MININNENIINRVNPHFHKIFTYKHTGFSELKTVEEAAMFHKNCTIPVQEQNSFVLNQVSVAGKLEIRNKGYT